MKNSRYSTNIWSISVECSRVITIWATGLAYRTWADDDDRVYSAINDVTLSTHEWLGHAWVDNCIWRKLPKLYTSKTSCSKPFWPPIWRPLKISPPKVKKLTYIRDRAVPSCKFSRRSARDSCSRAKIHIFLIRDSLGGCRPMLCIESSRRTDLSSNSRYSLFRGPNLGFSGSLRMPPRKGETLCLGPICTIMQNFTPSQSCTTLDPTRGSGRVGSDRVRKFAGKGGSGRVQFSQKLKFKCF